MKIKAFYPTIKATEKLSKLFSLPYNGQDWAIVNANDEKVDSFTEYYLNAEKIEDKVASFELLIASIDMLKTEIEMANALDRIKSKLQANLKYHLTAVIYWALLGYGTDEEHIFPLTKFMRRYLNEFMNTDTLEIINPSINDIRINGIDFQTLLEKNQFSISFLELVDFLQREIHSEKAYLKISEDTSITFEKETESTHFEMYSPKTGLHYFKIETNQLEEELKKSEFTNHS